MLSSLYKLLGSQAARILVEDNAVLEKRIGAPVELIGIAVRDTIFAAYDRISKDRSISLFGEARHTMFDMIDKFFNF